VIAWILAAPLLLLALLIIAAALESRIVAPSERAITIRRMMDSSSAEDLERDVAELLRAVDPPAPVQRS